MQAHQKKISEGRALKVTIPGPHPPYPGGGPRGQTPSKAITAGEGEPPKQWRAQRHPRLRPDQAGKCDGMGWRKLKAKAGCRAGLPGRACPVAAGTPGGHAAWRRSTGEQEAGPSCQGGPGPPGAGQRSRGCGRDPDVRERKRVAGMQRRRSAGARERRGPARVQGEASRRLAAIDTQAPRVATGRHPPEGGRGGDQICKVWPACWNGGSGGTPGPGRHAGQTRPAVRARRSQPSPAARGVRARPSAASKLRFPPQAEGATVPNPGKLTRGRRQEARGELRQEAGQEGGGAGMDAGASVAGGILRAGAGSRSRGSGRDSGVRETTNAPGAMRRGRAGADERRGHGSDQGEAMPGRCDRVSDHPPRRGVGGGSNLQIVTDPCPDWSRRDCRGPAQGLCPRPSSERAPQTGGTGRQLPVRSWHRGAAPRYVVDWSPPSVPGSGCTGGAGAANRNDRPGD